MSTSTSAISARKATRRFRSREERRRIVEETLSSEVSVSTVARAHGMNANLLFHWRKLYHAGLLDSTPSADATSDVQLLPVVVDDESAAQEEKTARPATSMAGHSEAAIHIEFPGHAYVSVVGSADPAVIRAVLESLRG